jgi:hypothetical protein
MAAINDFGVLPAGLESPPQHCIVVQPSDTAELTHVTRAISLPAAAALKVTTLGGETVVIAEGYLAPGVQHAMQITKIHADQTTAANILIWW